jgi:hypothetical protein
VPVKESPKRQQNNEEQLKGLNLNENMSEQQPGK